MNAAAVAQRGCKSERQAAAIPSDTFRQMLGPLPLSVYAGKSAWPAEVEIYCAMGINGLLPLCSH